MRLFVILIMSLLHKSCAEVAVMTAKIQSQVNFNDRLKCDSWKREEEVIPMPMNITESSDGVFKCSTNEDMMLLLVYEVFVLIANPNDAIVIDENLTLTCTLSTILNSFNITNDVSLVNETGNVLEKAEQEDLPELQRVFSSTSFTFIPTNKGNFTYKCLWKYSLDYEGNKYEGENEIAKTYRIYVKARNAKPDKTRIETGESVTCSAEGDPVPTEFIWTCDTYSKQIDGWTTSKAVITFTEPKEYSCTCVASHLVVIRVHHAIWNGNILVDPSSKATKAPTMLPTKAIPKGGGTKKPSGVPNKPVKEDEEEEEEEEEEEKDDSSKESPRDKKHPSASDANSVCAISALVLLLSWFAVMETK